MMLYVLMLYGMVGKHTSSDIAVFLLILRNRRRCQCRGQLGVAKVFVAPGGSQPNSVEHPLLFTPWRDTCHRPLCATPVAYCQKPVLKKRTACMGLRDVCTRAVQHSIVFHTLYSHD